MKPFHRNSLLIDTNLLILLLVGSCNPSLIGTNKITANQGFDEEDFNSLRDFIGRFQKLVTTPHILTEVSNHTEKIKGVDHPQIISQFAQWIETLEEHSESSKQLAKTEAFARYGLTDSAVSHLANKNLLVLTIDLQLAGYLHKRGVNVINFNHVRHVPQDEWSV